MTESESRYGPDMKRQLEEALRRERRERRELEKKAALLETQLATERNRLGRLSSRRSVRLALWFAHLASPVVGAIRNWRSASSAPQPAASEQEVIDLIRALRPDAGPTAGPLVTIVVLNDDGADRLQRLLFGLRDITTYRSFELVVVDKGSTDDSLALIDADWGYPIRVIRSEGPATFSGDYNQGLAQAKGPYVLLLNNGAVPINTGWLGAMVNELETNPLRGAVGALLVHPDRSGLAVGNPDAGADLTIKHRGISFRWRQDADQDTTVPWAYCIGDGEDPTQSTLVASTPTPAVTSKCMLVRTDLVHKLGGLDEVFIQGMEDVDLSLRIGEAGHSIAVVGSAVVFHHESPSHSEAAAARRRSSELSDLQHFSEKWGPTLSRMLQLEQLNPHSRFLRHRNTQVIAITVTRDDPTAGYDDWYTAHELGEALEATGFDVVYAERHLDRWYDLDSKVSAVICLIDSYDVRRAPRDAVTIAWVRNWTNRWIEQPWFGHHDVYVPGSLVSANLLSNAGVVVTEFMPLATNNRRFYPLAPVAVYSNDFVVTSNYWRTPRPGIEKVIVRPGEKFSIYGRGWEDVPGLRRYARGQLPYDELPSVYGSSKIVVDETARSALQYGALNSRVFDALATGTLVITNNRVGSDEVFDGELPVYSDEAEQRALLDTYLANDELRLSRADSLRQIVLKHHTYSHRATEIPQAAAEILNRPRIALKIGSPDKATAQLWGDTHFAAALAAALRRHGAIPSIHLHADWEAPSSQCVDVAVHIRGLGTYVPKPSHKNILWIISHPEQVSVAECNSYDLVLVASEVFAEQLRGEVRVPVEVMYQATDPDRFSPSPDPELATELLFAGNSRGQQRMAVEAALAIDAPLKVFGQGWDEALPPGVLAGSHFPNERLGSLYSSADVSLNDHWPEMARQGFISNRVFDIVASGGLVFSDPVAGLDRVFGELIPTFCSPEQLRRLLDSRRADPAQFEARMIAAREIVLRDHTFDNRARRFMEIIDELGWRPERWH